MNDIHADVEVEREAPFAVGDIVETVKGAKFWGVLADCYWDLGLSGQYEWQAAVRAIDPGFAGTRHVYPAKQLRRRSLPAHPASGFDQTDLDMIRSGDKLGPRLGARVFAALVSGRPASGAVTDAMVEAARAAMYENAPKIPVGPLTDAVMRTYRTNLARTALEAALHSTPLAPASKAEPVARDNAILPNKVLDDNEARAIRHDGASGTMTIDTTVVIEMIGEIKRGRRSPNIEGATGFAEGVEAAAKLEELEQLFDLTHAADMRAVVVWRGNNPGNELVLPDHVDLVTWLMDRLADADAALRPFAEFLPRAEEFVEKAAVTPGASPIMPSVKDFRLSHFRAAASFVSMMQGRSLTQDHSP